MRKISFIEKCFETSASIKDGRNQYMVLSKAMEELGELAQEVMIANNDHYKPAGADGIIGEAIDVMVCCCDLIYSVNPNITQDELKALLAVKLAKWVTKSQLNISE